jgi:cytochrome c oxidase assembly protein subunit 15
MIIQAVLVWKREPRSWVRKLTYSGLILVILQGVLGGLRVLLDKHPTPWEGIDAGLVLRIVHGCTAQAFTCLVAVLTLAQSQAWIRAEQSNRTPCTGATRTAGLVLIAALVTQLIVAVKMRHMGAGLAIPTFPLTPDGGILPTNWSYGVAIHFSHRVLAVLILILSGYWLLRLHLEVRQSAHWKAVAVSTAGLLLFQIGLGAWIIWSGRHPQVATAHVICGAAFLATVVTSVVGLIRLGVCQAPSLASANQVPATLEARS